MTHPPTAASSSPTGMASHNVRFTVARSASKGASDDQTTTRSERRPAVVCRADAHRPPVDRTECAAVLASRSVLSGSVTTPEPRAAEERALCVENRHAGPRQLQLRERVAHGMPQVETFIELVVDADPDGHEMSSRPRSIRLRPRRRWTADSTSAAATSVSSRPGCTRRQPRPDGERTRSLLARHEGVALAAPRPDQGVVSGSSIFRRSRCT